MPLRPAPGLQAIRQKRFPNCCSRCSSTHPPARSAPRVIDVSKKALRRRRSLALSNIPPVNRPPGTLHAAALPPRPCPAVPGCPLLFPALELPGPFRLLPDGFPWAWRCPCSISSDPSPPLGRGSSPPPQLGSSLKTAGSRPRCFPVRVTPMLSKPLSSPGLGGAGNLCLIQQPLLQCA